MALSNFECSLKERLMHTVHYSVNDCRKLSILHFYIRGDSIKVKFVINYQSSTPSVVSVVLLYFSILASTSIGTYFQSRCC